MKIETLEILCRENNIKEVHTTFGEIYYVNTFISHDIVKVNDVKFIVIHYISHHKKFKAYLRPETIDFILTKDGEFKK